MAREKLIVDKKEWTKKYELYIARHMFEGLKDKDGKLLTWEDIGSIFGVTRMAILLKRKRKGEQYFRNIYDQYLS